MVQNFNKPWPCGFKNGIRNGVNFHQSSQKSEKLYTYGLFLSKAYVSLRKFRRNYASSHWRVMQNWKESWFVAWKKTSGVWLIFMRAAESLKICTLMGSFWPKHIKIYVKKYRRVSLMTLKSDVKFEEKLTLSSKNDMMNLANFNASSGKSESSHFDRLLL